MRGAICVRDSGRRGHSANMASLTHHVFVDFENVPNVDLTLIENRPARVTLLIGKRQQKLDLKLVQQILRFADQVKLVEVGASGRNALDLTLACYLGRAIQLESGTTFAIVSRDKDFDPMIAHLKGTGVMVSRHDSLAAVPFLSGAKHPGAPRNAGVAGKSNQPVDRLERLAAQGASGVRLRPTWHA